MPSIDTMKKILIIGKDSYIGNNICSWLKKTDEHVVDILDVRTDDWKNNNFFSYDTVIHVAAIVHSKKSISWEEYEKVNANLPINVALKAKTSGVKQFIFLSSMAVYGQEKKLPFGNIIDETTLCTPFSFYGKSKFLAEQQLKLLEGDSFKVTIIRPPNVYGPECKGNYILYLKRIVRSTFLFPRIFLESGQGLLYIDNLCELVRLIVRYQAHGIFTPQNETVPNIVEIIDQIAKNLKKKIFFFPFPNFLVRFFSKNTLFIKLFGGVSYNKTMAISCIGDYNIVDFPESIKQTFTAEQGCSK